MDRAAALLAEIQQNLAKINKAKDELARLGLNLNFATTVTHNGTLGLAVSITVGGVGLPPSPVPPGPQC